MPAPPQYPPADMLARFLDWRRQQRGSIRDFTKQPGCPSEARFYELLKGWRDRVAQGLDPITGEKSADAASLAGLLEPETPNPPRPKTRAERATEGSGTPSLVRPADRDLRRALQVRRRAMRGDAIKPAQLKAALETIKDAEDKAKREVNNAASELSKWPTPALQALVVELAPRALAAMTTAPQLATPDDSGAPNEATAPDGLPASI